MLIEKIFIEKFRHLENLEINIGKNITAIAGQNGIGKSSILGLLGHVCREKGGHKSIDGRFFETEYSEIFKLSYPNYDKPKEHEYTVYFDNNFDIKVVSYERKERGKPISLRFRTSKNENGQREEAKINFPVLYLGLKRLFPLAQEENILFDQGNLSVQEIAFFNDSHNSILLMDEVIKPIQTNAKTKLFYSATTEKYDSLGNSAGQDNIGQIICSIISFQRLKKQLGNDYVGGVFLIDEIDATLFSAAQNKLIDFLFKASSNLNLQIVFTTHSIEILEQLITSQYKYNSKVCYLDKSFGKVEIKQGNDIIDIIDNLKVTITGRKKKKDEIDIYTEDFEAKLFLKNILTKENLFKSKFLNVSLGGDNLLDLANRKVPAFVNSLIVLDGDKKISVSKPTPKYVLTLPGTIRPENIFFEFLEQLDVNNDFWKISKSYTKQFCFKDQKNIGDRIVMKRWFNAQLKYWGVNGKNLFKIWKLENLKEIEDFNKKFSKALEKLASS